MTERGKGWAFVVNRQSIDSCSCHLIYSLARKSAETRCAVKMRPLQQARINYIHMHEGRNKSVHYSIRGIVNKLCRNSAL
jgi:hypothetical protein